MFRNKNMKTDYHCHILPGIDDGAKDMDEAVFLARKLVEWGYRRAICTPILPFATITHLPQYSLFMQN